MSDQVRPHQPFLPVPLQRAKLTPPVIRAELLPRPALLARLDEALTVRLTVVQAPAGHGKTSTLVTWLQQRQQAAAWVTVDANDVHLTRFAQHVALALEAQAPGVAADLLSLLTRPDAPGARQVGEAFGEALYDVETDLLLVLDDLHLASGPDATAFLEGLLAAAPNRLHVLAATRHQLPLPLARPRMAGDLCELTSQEMQFTPHETELLLQKAAVAGVTPHVAAALHTAVGGWPAAVHLLGAGLPQASGAALDAASQVAGPPLLAYLTEAVLSPMSVTTRDALLAIALPDQFSPALLRYVAEARGAAISDGDMARLRELDLFREMPGHTETTFAFHPLFREAFRALLTRRPDAEVAELHRAIARWFADHGQAGEAVVHLVAAGDAHGAAALVASRAIDAFDREDWQAVASWLAQIPEPEILASTELLLSAAWVAYLAGRTGKLGARLARLRDMREMPETTASQRAEIDVLTIAAVEHFETDPERTEARITQAIAGIEPKRRYRLGFAHLILAMALSAAGREREALQMLSEFTARESARGDAASIRGYFGRCLVLWQMAARGQCARTAADMLQLAETHHLPITGGWAHVLLGHAAFEQGRLDDATASYQQVIDRAFQLHSGCVREAFAGQILAYQSQGQDARALAALERYRVIVREAEHPEPLEFVESLAARLAVIRGALDVAAAWAAVASPSFALAGIRAVEHPVLTKAKVLIATGGDLAEAEALVAKYLHRAQAVRHRLAQMEGLAVEALLREAQGRQTEATAALRRSLVIAAPEGMTQRYLLLGVGLAPVLRRLRGDAYVGRHAQRLLLDLRPAPRPAPAPRLEPPPLLTPRDRDVLHCLGLRLTNSEIAEALGISPITAKNYVARLCAKLGVSNRRDAVAVARAQGLGEWLNGDPLPGQSAS